MRLDKAESVHLANAVEWELGKDRRADPELAARLGQLITPEFLKKLQEGRPDERDEFEHKALLGLLGEAQFQAADGSWHKATKLVVAVGEDVDADEKLRAAFAPQECRLNQAYTEAAMSHTTIRAYVYGIRLTMSDL